MKTNYHTHHGICGHAFGTAEMYISNAVKEGVKILGFSDHSPSSRKGDLGFRMTPSDLYIYLDDIANAKLKYKDHIQVFSGLEIEYLHDSSEYYNNLKNKVDYFILGQHFVSMTDNKDDLFSTYDFTKKEHLFKYLETIKRALKELPISILAHPDLYLINYQTWDEHSEYVAHEICKIAKETNTYIEFNANGFRRDKINTIYGKIYQYPRFDFFEVVKHYQLPVIVNSDCHHPSQVYDTTMKAAVNKAKELGLNVVDEIQFKNMLI